MFCTKCGAGLRDTAEYCDHCGSHRLHNTTPAAAALSSPTNDQTSSKQSLSIYSKAQADSLTQVLGIAGSVLLTIGVFVPFVRGGVGFSATLMDGGVLPAGTAIMFLGLMSLVLVFAGRLGWLWLTGICSLLATLGIFFLLLAGRFTGSGSELGVSWGFPVTLLGAMSTIAAAYRFKGIDSDSKGMAIVVAILFLGVGLVFCYFVFFGRTENIVEKGDWVLVIGSSQVNRHPIREGDSAPVTFDTKWKCLGWKSRTLTDLLNSIYSDPLDPPEQEPNHGTFAEALDQWIRDRTARQNSRRQEAALFESGQCEQSDGISESFAW